MDEESMDVEFDPEFMRLYYNKVRAAQHPENNNAQSDKEQDVDSLGNFNFVKNPIATKTGQLRRLRTNEVILKRRHKHEHKDVRPKDVKDLTRLVELKEDSRSIRQEELPSSDLSTLKLYDGNTEETKASFVNSRLSYKSTMLEERSPAFLRMVFRHSDVEIDIFDAHSVPVLKKQIVRMGSGHEVVRFQVIKEITMRAIQGREDIRIPQINSNDDMRIYLCPLKDCNEGFVHPHVAKNHALSHLDLRPFSCHFYGCGWTFAKESHLQRHLLTHENTKNYPCDEPGCDKLFTTIYNLNEHRKKRHIQPATKPCPVSSCKESFRNEKELKTHCKTHSDDDAPLRCLFTGCKRCFFFQTNLDAHTKTHLEENQHICTFNSCNKTFQQAYRLKEHMRCHTGAKPYKCTIGKCIKAFSTASKLKRHERSHCDDKHHYCNVEGCDKAFKRSDHLNEHIRQVHKVNAQGGQKVSTSPRPAPSKVDYTAQSTLSQVDPSTQAQFCMVKNPQTKIKATSRSSTSGCHMVTSEDEETDLSNYLAYKTEDELLDEAIKSLGVSEMKLETDLFLDEPLDLSDFSTVNLRDLH